MLSLSLSGIARPVKRVVSAADSGLTVSSSFCFLFAVLQIRHSPRPRGPERRSCTASCPCVSLSKSIVLSERRRAYALGVSRRRLPLSFAGAKVRRLFHSAKYYDNFFQFQGKKSE